MENSKEKQIKRQPSYIKKLSTKDKKKKSSKKKSKKTNIKDKEFSDFMLLQRVVYFPYKALIPHMNEEEK